MRTALFSTQRLTTRMFLSSTPPTPHFMDSRPFVLYIACGTPDIVRTKLRRVRIRAYETDLHNGYMFCMNAETDELGKQELKLSKLSRYSFLKCYESIVGAYLLPPTTLVACW